MNWKFFLLTRGSIASARAFNFVTRAFNLPTCAFNLAARAFRLLTRGCDLVTRRFELVTHGFALVTPGIEHVPRRFEVVYILRDQGEKFFIYLFFLLRIKRIKEKK